MRTSATILFAAIFCFVALHILGSDPSIAQDPKIDDVPEVAAPAAAVEPTVELGGVDKPYAVGDLIEVDAVVTGVDDPAKVTYDWKILPPVEFKKWPDGSKILLGTGPQPTEYTIFLAVGVLDGGPANPSQKLFTRIGTVKVQQDPVPSPPVNQPPADDPPAVELGDLGKEAVRLVSLVNVNEFYSNADLKKDAASLAANFKQIATQVDSGQIKTLEEALNKTREFNRGFPSRDAWAEWFSGVSLKLSQLNDNDGLDTKEKIVKAWNDIANGLSSLQ